MRCFKSKDTETQLSQTVINVKLSGKSSSLSFIFQAGEKSEPATGGLCSSCQPAADCRRQQPWTLLQTRC